MVSMISNAMSVIVVGGGIYGQVISWRLAIRGVHVIQIEPIGPGNSKSGSGDKSRIVRGLYGDANWAETGSASLPLWESWGAELGERLCDFRGVLYLENESRGATDEAFRKYVDAGLGHLRRLGREAEVLSPDEVLYRYPGIDTRGLVRAVFERGGGIGWASRSTRAVARGALGTGRVEHVAGTVVRLVTSASRVTGVSVDERGSLRLVEADHVFVAAATSGARLVEDLVGASLGIRDLPHYTTYWDVPWPTGRSLSIDALPPWAELGGCLYGFPDDGENGFKVAFHEPLREEVDTLGIEASWVEPPSASETERLRVAATRRFPALAQATLRATYQCRYDATDDENFQVGAVPGVSGLTFVGGMSGHGYKHAPAIGEALAQSMLGEPALVDLSSYAVRLAPRTA